LDRQGSKITQPIKIVEENEEISEFEPSFEKSKWTLEGDQNLIMKIKSDRESVKVESTLREPWQKDKLTAQELLSMDMS
jgi:hypothetical protein